MRRRNDRAPASAVGHAADYVAHDECAKLRVGAWDDTSTLYVWDTALDDSALVRLHDVRAGRPVVFQGADVERSWRDVDAPDAIAAYQAWSAQSAASLRLGLEAQRLRLADEALARVEAVEAVTAAEDRRRATEANRDRARRWRTLERFAVFSRNHPGYLQHASEIAARQPERQVTFRSGAHWVAVARALEDRGPVPILFAVIGEGPVLEYQALLEFVHLDPQRRDPAVEELLDHELRGPRGWGTYVESLWSRDRPVRTL